MVENGQREHILRMYSLDTSNLVVVFKRISTTFKDSDSQLVSDVVTNFVCCGTKCPIVWISPINQNWQGGRTFWGDPYHGYWVQDVSKLNEKFGTEEELKSLITELHRRGM